jgi:hypothetical protein
MKYGNNCSIGKTLNAVEREVVMYPKIKVNPCSNEKWYGFWVSILKKAVEKKKAAKHE